MKYNEILSAETISPQIAARLEELREARTFVQKCLKAAPEGKLRVATSKDAFRYYFVNGSNPNGKYISKENIDIAKGIAQKDYYEASLKAINNEIEFLSATYKKYSAIDSNLVYDQLKNGRKPLVTPMHLTDKEYAASWSNVEYRKKGFAANAPEFFTSKGLRVRSKSEVIIAEALYSMGIPFRYEFPISIRNLGYVHPDFYCLNLHTREEFIWEHFGMMDNLEYAAKNTEKNKPVREIRLHSGAEAHRHVRDFPGPNEHQNRKGYGKTIPDIAEMLQNSEGTAN